MKSFLYIINATGDILAKSFKWIYAKVCLCRICPGVAKRRALRELRKMRALSLGPGDDYYDEDVSIPQMIIHHNQCMFMLSLIPKVRKRTGIDIEFGKFTAFVQPSGR